MGSQFEGTAEYKRREEDILDYVRSETNRHLRKYSRRIKVDSEAKAKELLAADDGTTSIEVLGARAVSLGSQGMFVTEVQGASAPALNQ